MASRNGVFVNVGAVEDVIVHCTTTAGPITMILHRAWSPQGYARAKALFERGYFDQSHFFRVVPHFLVQFGISYTTNEDLKRFAESRIEDDPKREDLMPFREGMMSFAGSGPNSRTSQVFIAYDGAGGLGNSPWETPFGEVVDGMENVRKLYSYGDMPPWGKGPEQGPIRNRGIQYIAENFPLLDQFHTCTVSKMEASQEVVEEKEGSEVSPYKSIQAAAESTDSVEAGGEDLVDELPRDGVEEEHSDPISKVKDRRAIRGGMNGDDLSPNSFSFVKIFALISVLVIFTHKLAQRKKRIHSE